MAYKREYTAEERAIYNEKNQRDIEEMVKLIDEGVKAVFSSEKYKEYLKFVSKFTDYSARNTMLINMQKPDATLVAAYGKWKQLGRQVEKGQTGISILAPVIYKTDETLEVNKPVVDEFGNQMYNEDGTEKIQTTEKQAKELAFKKIFVFDVSQTSGKELPEPVMELSGNIDSARKETVLTALKKVTGIDIEFKDIKGGAKGYYSSANNQIVIKSGMSDAQTLKTAFHEAAHNLLHDPKKNIVTAKAPRNEKEVQAESVAFIVAEKLGMDTSEYSFPYIASWSDGKQLEQLKNALQEIQDAAKKISVQIESELLKMQKRHLSMEEKLADTELNNIQKAEFLIEDVEDRGTKFSKQDTDKILDFAGEHQNIQDTVKLVSDMETIQRQRDEYGYDFTYMMPIDTKEEALAAFDRGEAVYLLYPDNTEGMAEERSDIETFDGYFGIEKEPSLDVSHEQDSELIPVSKEVALAMWDKDLDVYIDGVHAESREQIETAPDTAKMYLSEFQYSSQLDFDRLNNSNIQKKEMPKESVNKNPNIVGNTPYAELGDKSELKYYPNLKNRHASNIAKALDEQGIRFSGLKKGTVTTLTVNKADIQKYEEIVEKVKASYSKSVEKPVVEVKKEEPVSIPEKQPEKTISFVDVPVCTQSFLEAKQNDNFDEWKTSIAASKVCVKYIDDNMYSEYENRNVKGFVAQLEEQFGIDRTMYTVAATIQLKKHDGRFTNEVKDRAGLYNFESDNMRLKFLTESHPVMLNHLYERLIDRERELQKGQPELEKPKLPDIYDDRFLYSTERVEVHDDYRGIPETKYYNSSVNEYFVDGIGWLNNENYDREQKMSDLNAKDFYKKVSKINASYVDSNGWVGEMDMTKQEYDLFTQKTYSAENAEMFEAAKEKLEERKRMAGVLPKQTEYYAVRKMSDNQFAVCTLSANGLVDVVKPRIASVEEAKRTMIELFESRKDKVRCELIHPQTLDEKSAELFKNQSKELPDVTYRILLNTDKNASVDNSHFLQEYVKNTDDSYAIGKVLARGDYERCNSVLAEVLNPKQEQTLSENITAEKQKSDFEIYQLKDGDDNRDVRFEPFGNLTERGLKPEFDNYIKVYSGNNSMLNANSDNIGEKLEAVFEKFNIDCPDDFKGHSLSVSDVVVMNDKAYYVDSVGFQPLKEFIPDHKLTEDISQKESAPETDKAKPQQKKQRL